MQQLRLAERVGRLADADDWLDEIGVEAYAELAAYEQLQPVGWEADRIAIRRLSYLIVAAAGGAKRLDEKHFDIVIGGQLKSDSEKRARFEAHAIRSQIEAAAKGETGDGR